MELPFNYYLHKWIMSRPGRNAAPDKPKLPQPVEHDYPDHVKNDQLIIHYVPALIMR